MIDLEKLKPILKDVISEDSMTDAILRIQEIDEQMDDTSAKEVAEENERLKEQNRKLTEIFFTGKKSDDDVKTPDEPTESQEEEEDEEGEKETFSELFEEKEYKKG